MFINILDCGARPDGEFDNTDLIQATVEHLREGGGTVYFPAGVYAMGSVRLYSNITVYIESGAVISAVGDTDRYPVIEEGEVAGFVRGTRR